MIVAAPIVAVVSIVGSASDAIDDVTDVFDSIPEDVVVPDPPEPPAGIGGESLIASDNFAARSSGCAARAERSRSGSPPIERRSSW